MRLHSLPTSYGWPTVRRHPRSLAEAWPAEYADPIEHHPSAASWLLADLAIAAILICVVAAIMFGVLV